MATTTKIPIMCDLCNISLPNQQTKLIHVLGKRHQLVLHQKHMAEVREKCGIFITGIPNLLSHEEILAYFAQYGNIVEYYFADGNRFALMQFDSEEPVTQLLMTPVILKGRKLNLKRRILKDKSKDTNDVNSNENFEEINDSLRNCMNFENQVVILVRQVQPNWLDMVEKYKLLCTDLKNVLNEAFAGCIVYPFGSTVTGVGFKTSDVDIYVRVQSLEGPVNSNDLQHNHATMCVNKSKKLLKVHSRLFSKVRAIPRAKTPIIKCVHTPTGISCDFNFKNMLGVFNSTLISYYLSLDDKLKSVMIIIKYWGKVHDLSGSTGKFSNYALILLLIFYLQHEPYHLPSVVSLQDPQNCLSPQEGWNGEFTKLDFVPESLRNQTIPEVLLGFFDFYSKFDYSLNVICPYLGKAIPKTDFIKPEELPNTFERYKVNILEKPKLKVDACVCVQDPFEHNHNVTSAISTRLLDEFLGFCKIGYEIFKDPPDDSSLLYRLFTDEVDCLEIKQFNCSDAEFKFKISMGNHLVYLDHEVSSNEDKNVSTDTKDKQFEMKRAWFNLVHKFTEMILTDILKFTVNIGKDCPEPKLQRLNGQVDVHDADVVESISFHCSGAYNLWDARRSISKDINAEKPLALIDKQTNITNYICDVLYKGLTLKEVILELKVDLHAKLNPTEMIFNVTKISSKKKYFKSFSNFFQKNIPMWFEKYISDLDNSVKTSNTESNLKDEIPHKSTEEPESVTDV